MVEWAILRGLPDDDLGRLLAITHRRRFRRGEVVFHEGDLGDTLHLVAKGKVVVKVSTPAGDAASLIVLGEGDCFGELALVSGVDTTRKATVIALEPTETRVLHVSSFQDLCHEQPQTLELLVTVLSRQLQNTTSLLLEALYIPAEKRVLRRVADLARIYSNSSGSAVISLTQEDIAGLAGTTRSTVNRVLREAERDGLVTLERGRVTVRDNDRLASRAR
jgi:CRP-like cAMP-binding protein